MKTSIIFCMLISCCVARSIDTGVDKGAAVLDTPKEAEVLDTPKEAILEKSDALADKIVEENLSQIEPQSDSVDGEAIIDDNKRFLKPTIAPGSVTTAQRPFTSMTDLLLVLNSMTMTAGK